MEQNSDSLHPVDQPDCSSDPERTSRFCSADWSWRGNGLYFMNVMLQRGDREPEPEPESEAMNLNTHTHFTAAADVHRQADVLKFNSP